MSPAKIRQYRHVPERLRAVVAREFRQSQPALALLDEFLPLTSYSRDFSDRLLDTARGGGGASWELRRLAALMLENQLLRLAPDDAAEFGHVFARLGLAGAAGGGGVARTVLREGYTTTEPRGFAAEFRRRLERLSRVHAGLRAARTSPRALGDFLRLARRECKITVARYVFTPAEVVARIGGQLRLSRGVPDLDHREPLFVGEEMERAVALLPDYEAEILRRLSDSPVIYWVSKATPSELNSLVEYPLTTVVLVVKPPGSAVEFEIKRAGKRRGPVLSVVYERGGYTVPPPHRLDGGSMLSFLRHEARSGALFANAYRQAHGVEPPMSTMVARSSIFGVPRCSGGEPENILEYFTTPERFGGGFREMRAAMKDCVYAFNENEEIAVKLPGDFALAVQFINHARPGQAILTGTSSFRLDKVAHYLSEHGPELYFERGLKTDYTADDARRLADDVLEEALGVYAPPAARYRSHRQYVAAALSTDENRARADHVFLEAMRQLGKYWGTMLALRGYSWGESFVARNVGLKSYWHDGRWKVRLVFMDHDCLNLADKSERDFHSVHAYRGIATDARYIGGDLIYTKESQTAVYFLRRIYQAPQPLYEEGRRHFYEAIRRAYKATHVAMLTNPRLGKFFHKVFLERLRDWDKVVASYFAMKSNGADVDAWKRKVRRTLKEKGYARHVIEGHLKTVEAHSAFLKKQGFLY